MFTLPYEAVDSITIANLIETRNSILDDIAGYENNLDTPGRFYHPDDYAYNLDFLPKLDAVIKHYGGDVC